MEKEIHLGSIDITEKVNTNHTLKDYRSETLLTHAQVNMVKMGEDL